MNQIGERTPLGEIIRDEIRANGPLTFARYMELALYYPELGYYRKPRKPFGIAGDYYTASSLEPLFGELVASFAGQRPILDLGAGIRQLSRLFPEERYIGFDWDQDKLPASFTGIIFANEFFDALPVHLLKKSRDSWRELLVDNSDNGFVWTEESIGNAALYMYAEEFGANLPENGLLEACLGASVWMERMASILVSGAFLIIDYGYAKRELKRFPQGTLMAYQEHQALDAIVDEPGSRDLTAHVNFTYLKRCARQYGFRVAAESTLASWAMHVWDEEELTRRWEKAGGRWRLQWKQIVFGLGQTFRVLLLKK